MINARRFNSFLNCYSPFKIGRFQIVISSFIQYLKEIIKSTNPPIYLGYKLAPATRCPGTPEIRRCILPDRWPISANQVISKHSVPHHNPWFAKISLVYNEATYLNKWFGHTDMNSECLVCFWRLILISTTLCNYVISLIGSGVELCMWWDWGLT